VPATAKAVSMPCESKKKGRIEKRPCWRGDFRGPRGTHEEKNRGEDYLMSQINSTHRFVPSFAAGELVQKGGKGRRGPPEKGGTRRTTDKKQGI